MLFNSLQYIVFVPVVVIIYFLLSCRFRWVLLLLASYYFYMCWRPEYVLLIMLSTLIDYSVSLRMGKIPEKKKRKKYLIFSLFVNLSILFAFKYFNFFNESITLILNSFNIFINIPAFNVLLPVGISFYTFQSIGYSIDVYRGNRLPEKHLGIYALYVAFFPQLVAGPIERSSHLIPQFYAKHDFNYDNVTNGLKLMAWGFFKKVVIADRLALIVDRVYGSPEGHTGFVLLLSTFFFAFQIYCDFSGYTDIARGTAKIMGFDIMQNFNLPYFSKSVREFWRRWHISLTSWFRDYVYISLGGNKTSKERWLINIYLTFLASGLWHGAKWTFVVWGMLHAAYYIIGVLKDKLKAQVICKKQGERSAFSDVIKTIIVFLLVCFAWIFFRADSISDAFYIIMHLGDGFKEIINNFGNLGREMNVLGLRKVGFPKSDYILDIALIVFLNFIEYLHAKWNFKVILQKSPILVRFAMYYALLLCIIFFGVFNRTQFIYFQF